jgi:branched-chain amino acid transport system substrate-binding protein
MKNRRSWAGIGMVSMMLMSAACGATDDDAGGADDPIKIMVTETLSSPTMSIPQSSAGALAAAEAINDAGGVGGRDIEIIECNDQLDPNQAAACIQKAVDEGVVGLVGVLNLFTAQLWPTLEQAELPFVGLDGNSSDQVENALSYPLTSGVEGVYLEAGRAAVEEGGADVVLVAPDIPQAEFVAEYVEQGAERAGGEVTETVPIDLGAPDMSSPAAQVVGADPDGVVCICNPGDGPKILKAVRQQGYNGIFAGSYSQFLPSDIEELGPLADNLYMVANIRPPEDPQAKQWTSEMEKYQPEAKQDAVSAHTWVAVHVIADLLKGEESPASSTLIDALDSAENLDTRGLTGPLTFTEPGPLAGAPRIPSTDVVVYGTDNGKRVAISDDFVDALR